MLNKNKEEDQIIKDHGEKKIHMTDQIGVINMKEDQVQMVILRLIMIMEIEEIDNHIEEIGEIIEDSQEITIETIWIRK